MKKIILICTFLLFALLTISTRAQTITVGSGTSTSYLIPVNSNWGYTYSQQIILQSEIATSGNIEKIKFYMVGGIPLTSSNDWTIYLGHTSKTSFSSNTDWVTSAGLTQVYSGTIAATPVAGWYEIILTTPFAYNNVDNLVVGVDENATSYDGSSNYVRVWTPTGTNRCIYYRSDTTNPDPANITQTGTRQNAINQMQLVFPSTVLPNCATAHVPADLAIGVVKNPALTWAADPNASSYDVYFGTATNPALTTNVTTTSFTPATLNANTTYYWKIVPKNSVGDAIGCVERTFTTGITLNYCTAVPTSVDNNGITNVQLGTLSNPNVSTTTYQDFTTLLPTDLAQNTTEPITVTLETGYSYNVRVFIDFNQDGDFTDAGENIHIGLSGSANPTSVTGNITIPATAVLGNTTMRVVATDNDTSNDPCWTGSYANVEDYKVNIIPAPSCLTPTALLSSNITSLGATFSWTASASNPSDNYEIYWSTTNTAPTSSTVPSSTNKTSPYTETGLAASTTYYWWVRANCGAGDTSKWVNGGSFKTHCPPYTIPYFEGFESGYTNATAVGGCLLQQSITGADVWTANSTATDYNRAPRTGTWNAYLRYGNEDWIYIPVSLIGGTGYTVELYARQDAANSANSNIAISYGTSAIATAMANPIVPETGIINGSYQLITGKFTPATTGTYYVGIKGYINSSPWYISLDDIKIEVTPPPTATTTVVNNVCFGGTVGTATAVVTNGTPPFTYSWSPSGGTAATATGLAVGTYTVTVTDANNVTTTATATITEPTVIVSNLTSTNITCNGLNNGSVVLAPTGGVAPYTYLWNNADTSSSLTGLAAGTYSVTITDANGCVITENVTITDPAVLTVANSSHTDVTWYGGNDGSATVSVTGGTAPYTYSWSPSGGTADTATGLVAGTYTVTVTDANGCTVTESFTIIQPIPLMVQSTSQTNAKCNGGADGTATIVAMGGNAPYTYLWSPSGGTNATATGLAAGTYSVLVTDATANTITETFVITEPGIITATVSNQSNVQCNGGNTGTATLTVTGGTAPFTYAWSHGLNTNNATVSNLAAGNYVVVVTDANGCTAMAPVSLSISQPSALVLSDAGTTNVSCYGQNNGSATVSVTGGVGPYTYLWSNGQSGATISNLTKGNYVVTVTDANNCTQTRTFIISEPAFVNAPSVTSPSFCAGQNATLADVVINGSNIKWYSTATGGALLPTTTMLVNGTTYYATQTVNGCESVRTAVQITLSQATPLVTTQLNVCSNTRIQNMIVDGFNYTQLRWYSSSTSGVQLPSSQLLANGTYYVSSVVGTCESVRQAIQVTVAAAVNAPSASFQTVCGGSTLNDLVVTKDPSATLNWYSSLQSMIPLANTTVVTTGTYYVQQVIGSCESSRISVQVQVTSITVPTIASITTCEGVTIADLNTGTTNYVWYTDNTTTVALPSTYLLTSGSYYIANQNGSCISARKNIAVNVSSRPASPTGQSSQMFGFAAKVSDLKMNQPNVSWYASANDAVQQVNQLPATHLLQDQTTYYGVLINANNCGSAVPTPVTVTLDLSNESLDLAQLKYYPNPVDSELNISYIEEIKKVEVFTITGQRVFGNDYQGNEVKVDLSRLSAGTYLVKIETAKASQFVKIVKK